MLTTYLDNSLSLQLKLKVKKKMVLLEMLWDDVVAGPQPERGLGRLRKIAAAKPLTIKDGESSSGSSLSGSKTTALGRSLSMPATPGTPSPSASPRSKENVWRSVFHPGSNLATRTLGSDLFDKPTHHNCPTVYDWMYSEGSRSKHV